MYKSLKNMGKTHHNDIDMKIAVASISYSLDPDTSPLFGRSSPFVITCIQ